MRDYSIIILHLDRHLETSWQFWLVLQIEYQLDVAADRLGDRLKREVRPHEMAVV